MKAFYIPSSKVIHDKSMRIQHQIYKRQLAIASRSNLIDTHGEWGIWYLGTKEELIGEGLVEESWLPGRGGNGITQQRVIFRGNAQKGEVLTNRKIRATHVDRLITIFRLTNAYRVFDSFPKVIRKEIQAIEDNKLHQKWLDEALRAEEQKLRNLPISGQEAKERIMPLVECLLGQILQHVVSDGVGGYFMASHEKNQIIDAVKNVADLIDNASFHLDVEVRQQIELEIRHKTVHADRAYSSFMKQMLSTRSHGQEG